MTDAPEQTNVLEEIRSLGESPEILSLRNQALARLARSRSRRRQLVKLGTTGIVVALGLAAATPYLSTVGDPGRKTAAAEQDSRFHTATGQRIKLTLLDGSRVTMNTATTLRIRYTDGERRLELDHGQIWCEVAKHDGRPFRVWAGGRSIEAHGTAFDVRAENDRTEVMLAEGKVTVETRSGNGAQSSVNLRPRELLVMSGNAVTLRAVDPQAWQAWQRGLVSFDSVPLSDAVKELNRYSETKFSIADERTASIRVSGVFRAGAVDAVVQTLAIGFAVKATPAGRGMILLRQGE